MRHRALTNQAIHLALNCATGCSPGAFRRAVTDPLEARSTVLGISSSVEVATASWPSAASFTTAWTHDGMSIPHELGTCATPLTVRLLGRIQEVDSWLGSATFGRRRKQPSGNTLCLLRGHARICGTPLVPYRQAPATCHPATSLPATSHPGEAQCQTTRKTSTSSLAAVRDSNFDSHP